MDLPNDETWTGECRCGHVRLAAKGSPMVTMACHCTGCRRMTASAYSLSGLWREEAFAVTGGEPVPGGLRGETRHSFCPHCMSWLFTRPPGLDGFVNVRTAMLDRAQDLPPYFETYTSERLPFAVTGAARSYERFPPQEDFGRLLSDYAASRSADRRA